VSFSVNGDLIAKTEKAAGSISEDFIMKNEFYAHSRDYGMILAGHFGVHEGLKVTKYG
jgi:hypothetical protein